MARINLEMKLFKDPRWMSLVIKTGDQHTALGMLVSAWFLAQEHWLKHRSIPAKAWPSNLELLVECEFATRSKEDGAVYVKGSKRQFAWLEQRSAGGRSKSPKKLKALENARTQRLNGSSENVDKNLERGLNGTELNLNGSEAPFSLLSSHYSLLNSHNSELTTQTLSKENTSTASPAHLLADLWNEHCGTLPKVKACVGKRLVATKKVWSEQSEDDWVKTITKMATSDFCKGSTGWVATYDWMIKPGNWLKVQEGNYDNNRSMKKTAHTQMYDNLDALERKWSEAPK